MFSWFWEFLYSLTKSIFRLIDGLVSCAYKLCGIETISVEGKDTDFLTYVLSSNNIMLGFKVAAVLGIALVCFFAIICIIRTVVKEKAEGTPIQIVGKAIKAILTFCFVPAVMFIFMWTMNVFVEAMFTATSGGSDVSLGTFLFGVFSQDAVLTTVPADQTTTFYLDALFDYTDMSLVARYIDFSEFDYFFAWVASIALLFALAQSLMLFIERAFSIAILFVVSPFSIATTVVDDGGHFKLWRDQVLVKFFTGYGTILGINVYITVVSLISKSSVIFFEDSLFLNNLMKIIIILGGGFALQKLMAIIGNLISSGAGTNEMRDAAMTQASMGRLARGIASAPGAALGLGRKMYNFNQDRKMFGFGAAVQKGLGLKSARDYASGGWSPLSTQDVENTNSVSKAKNNMNIRLNAEKSESEKNKQRMVENSLMGPRDNSSQRNSNAFRGSMGAPDVAGIIGNSNPYGESKPK